MDGVLAAIGALVPPVGVGLIFWFVLRSIIRADRAERAAIARLDAEESGLVSRTSPTPAPGSPDAAAADHLPDAAAAADRLPDSDESGSRP